MPVEILSWDDKRNYWVSNLPFVGKPNGYCVHKKHEGSKKGLLTKLELFAYFHESELSGIVSRLKLLTLASGRRPPYMHKFGKYKVLIPPTVIIWNKSPVEVKAYKQKGTIIKLEVTRGIIKGRGAKFIAPISGLNSLGNLIKYLTKNSQPHTEKLHDDFLYIDQFLNIMNKHYLAHSLHGQLKLLKQQKLRNNLKFGFKSKTKRNI